MKKPDWWPENPYPEDIFPMTTKDYVEAIPDPKLRTAVSGCIGRWAWDVAADMIWQRFCEAVEDGLQPRRAGGGGEVGKFGGWVGGVLPESFQREPPPRR